MRKLLAIAIAILSIGFMSSTTANASAGAGALAAKVNAPQIQIQIGRGRRGDRGYHRGYYRRARTFTQTRFVRHGWRTHRETYQVTYWPNGQTSTNLISRVRVS